VKTATNPVGSAMDGIKGAAKDITSSLSDLDADSETGRLAAQKTEERAANAKKFQVATARVEAERRASDAQEALDKAKAAEADLAAKSAKES